VTWIGRDDNNDATGPDGLQRVPCACGPRSWQHAAQATAGYYRMPAGVELHWVDDATGLLSAEACAGSRLLPFIEGSVPQLRSACAQRTGGIRGWFERLFGER
jgi:penicillin-binding protein 1B